MGTPAFGASPGLAQYKGRCKMRLTLNDIDYIIDLIEQFIRAQITNNKSAVQLLREKLVEYLYPRWPDIMQCSQQGKYLKYEIERLINYPTPLQDEIRMGIRNNLLIAKGKKIISELQLVKSFLKYYEPKQELKIKPLQLVPLPQKQPKTRQTRKAKPKGTKEITTTQTDDGGRDIDKRPDDLIKLKVAVADYKVSRPTLLEEIRKGNIKSYRSKDAKRNSPHLVSRAALTKYGRKIEIIHKYPKDNEK